MERFHLIHTLLRSDYTQYNAIALQINSANYEAKSHIPTGWQSSMKPKQIENVLLLIKGLGTMAPWRLLSSFTAHLGGKLLG